MGHCTLSVSFVIHFSYFLKNLVLCFFMLYLDFTMYITLLFYWGHASSSLINQAKRGLLRSFRVSSCWRFCFTAKKAQPQLQHDFLTQAITLNFSRFVQSPCWLKTELDDSFSPVFLSSSWENNQRSALRLGRTRKAKFIHGSLWNRQC